MPEIRFRIRWPDGTSESCYSPSSVVTDYFRAGESHLLTDFIELSRKALTRASERVREKYGLSCNRALDQIARLETRAQVFADQTAARVIVESIES